MMPDDNGWHLGAGDLADYAHGRSTPARAASAEAHLTGCAHCRSRLAGVLPAIPVDRMWQQILATVQPAPAGRLRRAVERMRCRSVPAAWFAAALRPRRLGVAAVAVLITATFAGLQTHPANNSGRGGTVATAATRPDWTFSAAQMPQPTRIAGRAHPLSPPGPLPTSSDRRGPVRNPLGVAPRTVRSSHSSRRTDAMFGDRTEPRDDIPWRSGRHPD